MSQELLFGAPGRLTFAGDGFDLGFEVEVTEFMRLFEVEGKGVLERFANVRFVFGTGLVEVPEFFCGVS